MNSYTSSKTPATFLSRQSKVNNNILDYAVTLSVVSYNSISNGPASCISKIKRQKYVFNQNDVIKAQMRKTEEHKVRLKKTRRKISVQNNKVQWSTVERFSTFSFPYDVCLDVVICSKLTVHKNCDFDKILLDRSYKRK